MLACARTPHRSFALLLSAWCLAATASSLAVAAELHVGAATQSITPDRPVALDGQMRTRIAKEVESPVMATALALESRQGEMSLDQAIVVSCDLVVISEGVLPMVRTQIKSLLPDFDAEKIFLNATHTHTAPVTRQGLYIMPQQGEIQPEEYLEFLADRVAKAAEAAWKSRAPGAASWGLGHAVVAHNRRAVYADGSAKMYGRTNQPTFRGMEGNEDHGLEALFFWDRKGNLIATALNVACPSQEVEGRSAVNADFWHEVRTMLKARHGENLQVLGWTGAAGDQSPHLQYRKNAEERMRKLRALSRLEELARRVVAGWEEAYDGAKQDRHRELPMKHLVRRIELPPRLVTREESLAAEAAIREVKNDPVQSRRAVWHQEVVDRFQRQQAGAVPNHEMELHVLRLGDVAIATNQFELFTDYGVQIKSRSPALQTFIIQLAGPGSYLPTERAVRGGGYSAIAESNLVGPEGGQVLVDRTVEAIESLWEKE